MTHCEKGVIFDLFRGTTHDGPGVRDTVFFAGCPLRCAWCHNPEGLLSKHSVWHEPKSCIGCMSCRDICKAGAIMEGSTNLLIRPELCNGCGDCVAECPTRAMAFIRRQWTLSELTDTLCRDASYYRSSGGGVTASGGECLMQHTFVAALFRELHARGIHTALDTSGYAPTEAFMEVLAESDCLLFDLKFMDSVLHRKFCGADNGLILANARHAAEFARTSPHPPEIWIRTPLIPDATATADNLKEIGRFIADSMGDTISRWELCAFNNVCAGKYRRLGMEWTYDGIPLLHRCRAEELLAAAKMTGAAGGEVYITGLLSDGHQKND